MWTVGDILPEIARHVDGTGVCLSTTEGKARALAAYNRICEELMGDDAWDGAVADVEFSVCDDYFSLPSHFESLRALTIECRPASVRPGGWRYLQQAPGLMPCGGLDQVVDLGDHFAVMRDLPSAMPIMVVSDKPEAETAVAVLHGSTPQGALIVTGGFPGMETEPGERIKIVGAGFAPTGGQRAQPLVTRHIFDRRPSMVTKSVTHGQVSLFGWDGTAAHWLATYGAHETRPTYRRYQLGRSADEPMTVVARVNLRFVPAYSEGERAMIQFRPPYGIYNQALAARDAGRFDDYQRYRNSALAKLRRQRENKVEGQTHTLNISSVRSGAAIATARRR